MHGTPRHAAVLVLRCDRVARGGGPGGRLLRRRSRAYGTGRALASTGDCFSAWLLHNLVVSILTTADVRFTSKISYFHRSISTQHNRSKLLHARLVSCNDGA